MIVIELTPFLQPSRFTYIENDIVDCCPSDNVLQSVEAHEDDEVCVCEVTQVQDGEGLTTIVSAYQLTGSAR